MIVFLALLDILGGICLAFSWIGTLTSLIGLFILVKGLFSIVGSLASKYYFDWMGWIDLIVGMSLIFGFAIPWLWILPILKGSYSLVFSFK